jgi:hypothetical protein
VAKHKCDARYVVRERVASEHLEKPDQLATKGAEALYHRRVEAAVAAARKRDVRVVLALFLCGGSNTRACGTAGSAGGGAARIGDGDVNEQVPSDAIEPVQVDVSPTEGADKMRPPGPARGGLSSLNRLPAARVERARRRR